MVDCVYEGVRKTGEAFRSRGSRDMGSRSVIRTGAPLKRRKLTSLLAKSLVDEVLCFVGSGPLVVKYVVAVVEVCVEDFGEQKWGDHVLI